jgi:plasmid maintenance system antidote protein VapI
MKKWSYTLNMSKELADVLRSAIIKCGISATQLANETGVPQPTITRFLNGADMKLSTAQTLAAYLGLELRPRKR